MSSIPTNTPRKWCSTRFTVSYMSLLGFACGFMGRANLSITMPAMANSSFSTEYDVINGSDVVCPPRREINNSNNTSHEEKEGEFPWDARTQEVILGAFYYGYPVLQIPVGLLCDKVPKSCPWTIGLCFLISSICTLCFPFAAYRGVGAAVAARALAGLAEGGTFPAVYSLLSRWTPPAERSLLLAIAFTGPSLGQIIAQPVGGLLSRTTFLGGWPSSFYLFGTLGILWFIAWTLLVYDSPTSHPRISRDERDYLVRELHLDKELPKSYPWKQLFTSVHVWAVVCADFALVWIYYSLLSNIPIYLSETLRFDITKTGGLSAIPFITFMVFNLIGGYLADLMISTSYFSLTTVRKFMVTIGFVPSVSLLVLTGYVGCNATLAITFLTLGFAFSSFALSGYSPSVIEMAAPYAGMIIGMGNVCSDLPGFVGPLILSVFTENQANVLGWRSFFWTSLGVVIFGWLFFLVFGTSERQPWAQKIEKSGSEDRDNRGFEKDKQDGQGEVV